MRPSLAQARSRLAGAGRALAGAGLVIGSGGNLSVRVGEHIAITASGARLATVTAEQVSVVDGDGNPVAGELAPSSELELHLLAHRRPGTAAVVHTHAPAATALSCVLDELPVVHYQLLTLGGPVRVAPYATFGSPELAAAVLAALDGRAAALMANHGALTVAADLDTAVEHMLLLEWACGVYRDAAALGNPRVLGEREQQDVIAAALRLGYGAPRRREAPGG